MPIAWWGYHEAARVTYEARSRLITEYRLWELHPEYPGTPETWRRFASRLLSDRQLLLRIERKYGDVGEQIALDYRRDLAIAQAEVVVTALVIWIAPLGLCYAAVLLWPRRRARATPVRRAPASAADSRYLE